MCALCNQSWSHHWFLSDSWSVFQFPRTTVSHASRDDLQIVNSSHSWPRWTVAWRVVFRNVPPNSLVHVQVLHVVCGLSVVDLSYDRTVSVHVRHDCWRHVEIMWPFLSFSFRISWVFWIAGYYKFPCCFFVSDRFPLSSSSWLLQASESENFHNTWFFICCDKFPCDFLKQPAKVCILQLHLRTRRCVGFRISCHPCFQVSLLLWASGLLDAIGIFADDELVWTVEDKFKAVDFDFFFSFLFLYPLSHHFGAANQAGILSANGAELLVLNERRRLFHSSRVKFPFVNMSASWCLVSMYLIWIFGSRLILSNNQYSATLWVRDMCLIGFCLLWSYWSQLHCPQKFNEWRLNEQILRLRKHINIDQIQINSFGVDRGLIAGVLSRLLWVSPHIQ